MKPSIHDRTYPKQVRGDFFRIEAVAGLSISSDTAVRNYC